MTYADALAYLDSFVNYEKSMQPDVLQGIQLNRMRTLCEALGDPQSSFRSVVVAGTNGKGSVSEMTYSILKRSALKVGLYTSPHLNDIRERIRISKTSSALAIDGDDWITQEQFVEAVLAIRTVIESRKIPKSEYPTYFEMLTVIAFWVFAQSDVDIAVLEVGLGGRLDAVNIVDQSVSVLTPIGMDHVDILGGSLESIAHEKAGIIKADQVVVTGRQDLAVLAVIEKVAQQTGAQLHRFGQEFNVQVLKHSIEGLDVTLTGMRGLYSSMRIGLLGRHQAENAALAVAAVEALSDQGIPISSVEHGLSECIWPGRCEIIQQNPLVMLDGAHNQHAMQVLASTLGELFPKRRIHILAGMSDDKQAEALGALLGPMATSITCTQAHHARAMDAQQLSERINTYCSEVSVMPDMVDAYMYLLNSVNADDVIVATGSLYMVGELRTMIQQAESRTQRAKLA